MLTSSVQLPRSRSTFLISARRTLAGSLCAHWTGGEDEIAVGLASFVILAPCLSVVHAWTLAPYDNSCGFLGPAVCLRGLLVLGSGLSLPTVVGIVSFVHQHSLPGPQHYLQQHLPAFGNPTWFHSYHSGDSRHLSNVSFCWSQG